MQETPSFKEDLLTHQNP